MLDTFFWWSGLFWWVVLGLVGALFLSDMLLDNVMQSVKLKREFLEWAWQRTRAKAQARGQRIPGN